MSRLKLFILLGFAIMFVAGLEVGRAHTTFASVKGDVDMLVSRLKGQTPIAPATQPNHEDEPPLLLGRIHITSAQDQQIRGIFTEARSRADAISHQYPEVDHERENEILAILDSDQKQEYIEIQREHDQKVNAMRAEVSAIMKKAGDDVRPLLTPDQQKQYDDLRLKWDRDHAHRGGPGGGPRHRRGGPDTAPDHFPPPTAP